MLTARACRPLGRTCEADINLTGDACDDMGFSGEMTKLRPHKQTDEAMSISSGETEGEVQGKLLEAM